LFLIIGSLTGTIGGVESPATLICCWFLLFGAQGSLLFVPRLRTALPFARRAIVVVDGDWRWLLTREQACFVYIHAESELLGLKSDFFLRSDSDGRLLPISRLV